MTRGSALALVMLLAAGAAQPALGAPPEEAIAAVEDAIALVRVQRLYAGGELVICGSGIFVHPEGYLMTDLGVVAERFEAPAVQGGAEIEAPVMALSVVVRDAQGRVRRVQAEVVGMDRRGGLALLKIPDHHGHVVDLLEAGSVPVLGDLYILGYPWAGLLEKGPSASEADPRLVPIPAPAAGLREVGTELVIDRVRAGIQLDAGHCGSLVLNGAGTAVGIAQCAMSQATRHGLVLPLGRAADFLVSRLIAVDVAPAIVLKPVVPIAVRVAPQAALPQITAWEGQVEVMVEDRVIASIPLTAADSGWAATVDLEAIELPAGPIARIVIRVSLRDADGRGRFRRRVDVDVVPGSLEALVGR